MSNEIINPYQTFRDDNGVVLANGTITFYVNTTTTLDSIFSDEALTVSQSNPYTFTDIHAVAQKYDLTETETRQLLMEFHDGE